MQDPKDGRATRPKPAADLRHDGVGPFAPPTPSEAEVADHLPMAVANDLQTPHDAFMPTTASLDAFDPEVAARHRAHPPPRGAASSPTTTTRDENRAQEKPEGYTDVDKLGFRQPTLDGDE